MDTLLKISTVIRYNKIGIVVVSKRTTDYAISYYQMLKKSSAVDICLINENLSSLDQIDKSGENLPTIVCFHGSGLVQRIIKGNFDDISQNIPNINPEEYVIETDQTDQEEKLVALCRKEQIVSILTHDTLQRLPLYGISLGFIALSKYLQLFQKTLSTFEFEGNTLHFQDNRILEIRRGASGQTEEYFFAGKPRKASQIIALAGGLCYFTEKTWTTFDITTIRDKIKEFTAYKLTNIIFYYLGAILFVLLMINFLLFDHYNAKGIQLQSEYSGIQDLQTMITQLQTEINVKKQFIEQNNIPENYAFAFYADRLASYADGGIRFSELVVCPLVNKVKKDKVIGFYNNTLRVTGTAPNSTTFSIFLEKINKSAWVEKISKQVYVYNNENDNAGFELEIILSHAID